MKHHLHSRPAKLLRLLGALAMTVFIAAGAGAATPPYRREPAAGPWLQGARREDQGSGGMGARTSARQDQADAAHRQEVLHLPGRCQEADLRRRPEGIRGLCAAPPRTPGGGATEAAAQGSAYRAKQDDAMRAATARDLSNPFLGATWDDLGGISQRLTLAAGAKSASRSPGPPCRLVSACRRSTRVRIWVRASSRRREETRRRTALLFGRSQAARHRLVAKDRHSPFARPVIPCQAFITHG